MKKRKVRRFCVILGMVIAVVFSALAQEVAPDSVPVRKSFLKKVGSYLMGGVGDSVGTVKLSRFSIIGGPHYDSEAKFGLGVVGTSQFRLNGCDSLMQPSNIAVTADASIAGFFALGLKGSIFFPGDSKRLLFEGLVGYSPSYFWGIGEESGDIDENESLMKRINAFVRADFMWRLAPGLFAGPAVQWQYDHTIEIERPELLADQKRTVSTQGLGFTIEYDTRDYVTAATSGVLLHYTQLFNPKFLGNSYAFSMTDLRACYYHGLWRKASIAGEVKATFNFGNPCWGTMSRLGSSWSMRGYYPGRYRDKHLVASQVELRQTVWGPLGVVVWGGVGNVFHDTDTFKKGWLPNYGIGVRWAFRPHVNIRLDYGFGKKGQNGFLFAINEAF